MISGSFFYFENNLEGIDIGTMENKHRLGVQEPSLFHCLKPLN